MKGSFTKNSYDKRKQSGKSLKVIFFLNVGCNFGISDRKHFVRKGVCESKTC